MRHILPCSLAILAWTSPALAGALQIDLVGLGRPNATDASASQRFRSLASELGAALGSGIHSPAETLGYSGFNFGLEMSVTDIDQTAPHWRGQAGQRVWGEANPDPTSPTTPLPTSLWASRLHVRKGLPFSFELGATATYLMGGLFVPTDIYAVGGEVKWCLYEKFFRYLPDLGARFAMTRLLGSRQIDLTQAQLDVIASYSFGVGGQVNLTPYFGGSYWTVHAISQVLDDTPWDNTDQSGDARGSLYVLPEVNWQDNFHYRGFFGMRLIVSFVEILFEGDVHLLQNMPQGSTTMITYSAKLGFDY